MFQSKSSRKGSREETVHADGRVFFVLSGALLGTLAARTRLADLLQQQGDAAGAQQELTLVHSLAPGYRIPTGTAALRAGL